MPFYDSDSPPLRMQAFRIRLVWQNWDGTPICWYLIDIKMQNYFFKLGCVIAGVEVDNFLSFKFFHCDIKLWYSNHPNTRLPDTGFIQKTRLFLSCFQCWFGRPFQYRTVLVQYLNVHMCLVCRVGTKQLVEWKSLKPWKATLEGLHCLPIIYKRSAPISVI